MTAPLVTVSDQVASVPPTEVIPPPSAGNDGARPRRKWFANWTASMWVGAAILGAYTFVALLSFVWTPNNPMSTGVGMPYEPPSGEFLMGTDRLGSDVLSRVMAATRFDLGITIGAVLIALSIGSFLGTIAGYYGGLIDAAISRVVEIFQAFPTLLFAMLIVQAIGPGIVNIILVLAFVGIPPYLRLARAEIMSRRSWQFAEAAQMVGCRPWRVAFRHLLPNSLGPLLAFTSVNAAWVALITASLGFLGIGLEPGVPEWGSMVARGQDGIMTGDWWVSFFPGLAILGMAGAFYMLGDGLADANDPRRRA